MKVKLSSCGNPDYRQYTSISPPKTVSVDTFAQASSVCREYISEHELGGGNWSGGQVCDDSGKQVANVSYNGRVWDMGGKEIPTSKIMIGGEFITIDGDIQEPSDLEFYENSAKGVDFSEMTNDTYYPIALRTMLHIGKVFIDTMKDYSPNSDDLYTVIEKRFDGEWFTSGGHVQHVLIKVNDNFHVIAGETGIALQFSKKVMTPYERAWEEEGVMDVHSASMMYLR